MLIVVALTLSPVQARAASDALAELDEIIAAIEREFLGVEPPPEAIPATPDACVHERDDLFNVFANLTATFEQIDGALRDIEERSVAIGEELSLPCPRRFLEATETEIDRLEQIDITSELSAVRALNDCAVPAFEQAVARLDGDMLPAQRTAVQQRADSLLSLESESTNMLRQYGFFEERRGELLRGLRGNLDLCD